MSDYKLLSYTFARRNRNLNRISEELIWAGDFNLRSNDTLLDIAKAKAENDKTDKELLGRFIF